MLGATDQKKISWVKWDSVLATKKDGGLGFGSLEAMNQALLYRWRWRALSNPNNIWVRIIAAIHGNDCFYNMSAKNHGVWHRIAENAKDLHKIPSINPGIISRKVGDGKNTKFWKDVWNGDITLAKRFPRLFALEMDKDCMVSDRRVSSLWSWNWRRPMLSSRDNHMISELLAYLPSSSLTDEKDKWAWQLNGKSFFSIAQLRLYIDHCRLPINSNLKTCWNNLIPKKVNIFIWRLRRDCLPNFINLFAKGVDVTTVTCALCGNEAELPQHTFQQCKTTSEIRNFLSAWLGVLIPNMPPDDIISWCDKLKFSKGIKKRLQAVIFVWWWSIWKARNNKVHNDSKEKSLDIYNDIVSFTYLWIANRDRKNTLSWEEWIKKPMVK